MRILVQCVKNANVVIQGKLVSSISRGELILVGFNTKDTKEIADKMLNKLLKMRIFPDENDKTNLSINDIGGSILCVSQFTLYGSLKDGNRPSFVDSMKPDDARKLYEYFASRLKEVFPRTEFGVFQTFMEVSLLNDGPFTILLDSKELGYGD